MKRILLTLVTLTLVVSSILAFTACNRELPSEVDISGYGNSAPTPEVVGDKVKPIDANMKKDATAIFLNAIDNFYLSDYSAVLLLGKVDTDVKISKVTQMVECLRLHDGDDVFMYNNSYTAQGPSFVDIKVMEKYYIDGTKGKLTEDGDTREYKIISAGDAKNIDISPDANDPNKKILKANKWPISETYTDHDKYMAKYPNDPSVLNMYKMDNSTIKKSRKRPQYVEYQIDNEGNKVLDAAGNPIKLDNPFYRFTITGIAKPAFKDNGYIDVMEYMLRQSVPGNVNMDKPMELNFQTVEVWPNGLFKRYIVEEKYSVKAAGIIDGDIALISEVKFSYDKEESPMSKFYNRETGEFVPDAVAVG